MAEHHDGFAMYDSGLSDWTAAKMGPHRYVIGDLGKAVRAADLRFGVSSHRVEHNFFLGVGRAIPSDVNDPQCAAFYGPAHNWLANPWGSPSMTTRRTSRQPGSMIGWREAQSSSRNIIPTLCTLIGGSGKRRSVRI